VVRAAGLSLPPVIGPPVMGGHGRQCDRQEGQARRVRVRGAKRILFFTSFYIFLRHVAVPKQDIDGETSIAVRPFKLAHLGNDIIVVQLLLGIAVIEVDSGNPG